MSARSVSFDLQDWPIVLDPTSRDRPNLRMEEFQTVKPSPIYESTKTDTRPATPLEALMCAAPGDTPAESLVELQVLREAVVDCVEQLSEEHRFIVEAIHSERLSIAALGERLGVSKTHADRLIKAATEALRQSLLTNPVIRERLGMPTPDNVVELRPTTWDAAARRAVLSLAPVGAVLDDRIASTLINRKIEQVRRMVREGHIANEPLGQPLVTIGNAAACMLSNRGLWDADELIALVCRKQHDYGHGNILAFGMVGVAVRCSDKVARWENLSAKGAEGAAEPTIDALVDMVGYAVIATMLMKGWFELNLASDYTPQAAA